MKRRRGLILFGIGWLLFAGALWGRVPPVRAEGVTAEGTCVAVNDTVTITPTLFERPDFEKTIQAYLNAGGSINHLREALTSAEPGGAIRAQVVSQDVTLNGIPDLFIGITRPLIAGYGEAHVLFFTCVGGQYEGEVLFRRAGAGSRGQGLYEGGGAVVESLRDLNGNGTPDVFFSVNWPEYAEYYLLEWDGKQLASLIEYKDLLGEIRYRLEAVRAAVRIVDIEGDGVYELVGGSGSGPEGEVVWRWDGAGYSRDQELFTLADAADDRGWRAFTNANCIQDLAAQGDYIWIATCGGVLRWSRNDNSYIKYTTANGLADNDIDQLVITTSGHVQAYTAAGISQFNGQTWGPASEAEAMPETVSLAKLAYQATYGRRSDPPDSLLVFDPAGRAWFGLAGQGVRILDLSALAQDQEELPAEAWTTYTTAEGLPSNWISDIAFDEVGNVWVGTKWSGLGKFDGQSWRTYSVADGLASNVIDFIAIDGQGKPWVGTPAGINHFDGQNWRAYTIADGLPSNQVTFITIDDADLPWVATSRQISRFNGQRWQTLTPQPALIPNQVPAIAVDNAGHVWVGDDEGAVYEFDGQAWTRHQFRDNPGYLPLETIVIDAAGQPWVGAAGQASYFDGQNWVTYTEADGLGYWVNAIGFDPAGNVWFATKDGLNKFDGQRWTGYTTADGLTSNDVAALAIDPAGHVWVGYGFSGDGASKFDGQRWTSYTTADGLAGNQVQAIAVGTDGDLWFGTERGLFGFDGQNWRAYTTADGLIDNWVSTLGVDLDGHLWLGYGGRGDGVTEFDGQRWTSYTTADGLAGNQVEAIAFDGQGRAWFATNNGVSQFGPGVQPDLRPISALVDAVDPTTPPTRPTPAQPKILGPPENLPPTIPPQQPLAAWSVAADGALFALDAANRLYQLDLTDLTPLAQSQPLFQTEADPSSIYLAAGAERLFVSNRAITTTLVLDRATFVQIFRLDQAGPLAVDPGQNLFMLAPALEPPLYRPDGIWAYDLTDLNQAPQLIQYVCASGPPAIDATNRRLYLKNRNCESSPPHRGHTYTIYDLESLNRVGYFSPDPFLGILSEVTTAKQAGFSLTVHTHPAGIDRHLLIFDQQGQQLGSKRLVESTLPQIDAAGRWLYFNHQRALVVRRASDFRVQSVWPYTRPGPSTLLLSNDSENLYLLGNGWLTAKAAKELQQLGKIPISPLPTAWLEEKDDQGEPIPVSLFPSPDIEGDGIAFLRLGAEVYRSADGGHSWSLLLNLSELLFIDMGLLSISPDFSADQTLVAGGVTQLYRSTDGGDTWAAWQPRLAFTSDRDGNREIYTMTGKGEALQRLTNQPAADENPAWSPAWTRLAFQSDRTGNWDIFTIRGDCPPAETDCELRQLTNSPGDDMLPAWSPDGRYLAFVSTRDGNPEIYVMAKDGRNQRRLTFNAGGDWRPAWRPDSRQLVFTTNRSGNNDIYMLTLPSAAAFPLTAEPELMPVVVDPADDRDPALDREGRLYFLSDREGVMKTYSLNLNETNAPARAYHPAKVQAEAHPTLALNNLLVTMEGRDAWNIYQAQAYGDDIPLTDSPSFDGQPAGGAVWWRPDRQTSVEWLLERQN